MKGLIAILVATLDASTHPLTADVTCQLPTVLGDFVDILDWFHECVVSERDLGNPHGT